MDVSIITIAQRIISFADPQICSVKGFNETYVTILRIKRVCLSWEYSTSAWCTAQAKFISMNSNYLSGVIFSVSKCTARKTIHLIKSRPCIIRTLWHCKWIAHQNKFTPVFCQQRFIFQCIFNGTDISCWHSLSSWNINLFISFILIRNNRNRSCWCLRLARFFCTFRLIIVIWIWYIWFICCTAILFRWLWLRCWSWSHWLCRLRWFWIRSYFRIITICSGWRFNLHITYMACIYNRSIFVIFDITDVIRVVICINSGFIRFDSGCHSRKNQCTCKYTGR